MPRTDAQRRAQNKYDAAHYTSLTIKVTKEYADIVRAVCAAAGVAPASIMRAALDKFIKENATGDNATGDASPDPPSRIAGEDSINGD
jgi:hypothetical protein